MTMQKWMSSMPISRASGSRIGDRMTMFGVVSMMQPAATRTAIMIRTIRTGSVVSDVVAYTMLWGTLSAASVWASGREMAMIGRIAQGTAAAAAN